MGNALREEIGAAIAAGMDRPWREERFRDLALRLFAFQFERNAPYRRFCEARGKAPAQVRDWREIPAVPTSVFKATDVFCYPPEAAGITYLTSGTTGQRGRGRHRMLDTALYDASLHPNLERHLFPDTGSIRIAVLGPSPHDATESSLAHMLGRAVERWGAPGSDFYIHADQIHLEAVETVLKQAELGGEPVCLMGTAFAFVHLLDHLHGRGRRFRLPPGSRLMDTGGYKGRSREVAKEEMYRAYEGRLGLAASHIVNEYGMTEMSSQFYDCTLWDRHAGHAARRRQKIAPPWVRTETVDPETLFPLAPGQTGLLRHLDLANVDSVAALQTEDLGVWLDDGFEILGRAAGAEPRGCSLPAQGLVSDEALQAGTSRRPSRARVLSPARSRGSTPG